MKYAFATTILKNEDGTDLPTTDKDPTPYTAAQALQRALLADTPKNADTKLERYELFLKLRSDAEDFTAPEVSFMREAALIYPTLLAGQLIRILDQKA